VTIPELNLDGAQSTPSYRLARIDTRVALSFFPQAGDPVYDQRDTRERLCSWDPVESAGSVMSLKYQKRLGAAAGTWSAVIKLNRGSRWLQTNARFGLINASAGDILGGDWASCTILRNGYAFPLFTGPIENIFINRSASGGATVEEIEVVGFDHGKLFEAPISWNNIYVQSLGQQILGLYTQRVKGKVGDAPSGMFRLLIDAAFGAKTSPNTSAWKLPPALGARLQATRFGDALRIVAGTTRGALFNELRLWTDAGQTLHQALMQWCNPLLNEIFYDLATPGTLQKVGDRSFETSTGETLEAQIRERPFINTALGQGSPWFALPELTLPDWAFTQTRLGRSNSERFTIFEVLAENNWMTGNEQIVITPPRWSKAAVDIHGVRPFLESTKFIIAGQGAVAERKLWQQLVTDWYAPNPYWLSGSKASKIILPEARIGSRLRVNTGDPSTSLSAYIEGVDHQWVFTTQGQTGSTRLLLTRGFEGRDRDRVSLVSKASAQYRETL
jgi:hypothetical protein